MVSDDHEGIKVAGELSGVDRQRCVVYFERNVLAHVPASSTEENQDLPLLNCESLLTKHTCFQPRIAECSARVEPLD
jgi:Transposase, Mutator family